MLWTLWVVYKFEGFGCGAKHLMQLKGTLGLGRAVRVDKAVKAIERECDVIDM